MDIDEPIDKKEYENVLPLVNIVFLLLIFFMMAGAFIKPDAFPVIVPTANIDNTAEQNKLIILMDAKKQFAIDKDIYQESELLQVLQDKISSNKKVIVQVKADANVKSQDLIAIMDKMSATGLSSIRLLTTASVKSES